MSFRGTPDNATGGVSAYKQYNLSVDFRPRLPIMAFELSWLTENFWFRWVPVLVTLADGLFSSIFGLPEDSFILSYALVLSSNRSLVSSNVGQSQFHFPVCMDLASSNFCSSFSVAWPRVMHWRESDGSALTENLLPRPRLSRKIRSYFCRYAFLMAVVC